jgi:hypothetical protein
MPNFQDRVIEAIFDALPATSYGEITRKVNRTIRHVGIGVISNALCHLRRNSAEYGWTVPHVKRGSPGDSDKNRFFPLLVDRDGRYELDSNPEYKMHLNNGALATAQHAATMLANEAAAIRLAAMSTRSVNARAKCNDLADDFAYVAKKAAAVARDLRANAA